jgi:hypothetical protein
MNSRKLFAATTMVLAYLAAEPSGAPGHVLGQ